MMVGISGFSDGLQVVLTLLATTPIRVTSFHQHAAIKPCNSFLSEVQARACFSSVHATHTHTQLIQGKLPAWSRWLASHA